jgi:hypothetical protein
MMQILQCLYDTKSVGAFVVYTPEKKSNFIATGTRSSARPRIPSHVAVAARSHLPKPPYCVSASGPPAANTRHHVVASWQLNCIAQIGNTTPKWQLRGHHTLCNTSKLQKGQASIRRLSAN